MGGELVQISVTKGEDSVPWALNNFDLSSSFVENFCLLFVYFSNIEHCNTWVIQEKRTFLSGLYVCIHLPVQKYSFTTTGRRRRRTRVFECV